MTHSTTSLRLRVSKEAMPTVEINLDKLEKVEISLDEFVGPVLSALARRTPEQNCTIYQYMTQSVNFMHHCWSVFLIVDGNERYLTGLAEGIGYRKESESRISDGIPPLEGTPLYHLQDGELWTYASGEWERMSTYDAISDILVEEELDEEEEEEITPRAKNKCRQRAARNDARVGSIKTKIETLFGLPEGSVILQGPNGQPLRADAFIRTLRARWGYDN